MLFRIHSLGSCLIVITLLLFAGSAVAQDVSPRCEAAMDRAAGDYSRCLLRADASYARHENLSKLENRRARCETRFDRRTGRAINRHGADECPSSDLVAAMEDRTATYSAGVASEAQGLPAPSYLFVQNATGGTLTESTLTLTGVSPQTGWFTDRPYRKAGSELTEKFVSLWDEGWDSYADNPPNADFTCEIAGEVKNYVVELTAPSIAGDDLSYAVDAVGDTVLPQTEIACESASHLFVDINEYCGTAFGGKGYGCACTHTSECCKGMECMSNGGAGGEPPSSCIGSCHVWTGAHDGTRCDHNGDCHSKQCALAEWGAEHETCIPCDSEPYSLDLKDYSTCMKKGYKCHTSGMCDGDLYCDNGLLGTGVGTCK